MGIHSITLIIVMICSIGLGISQKHETDKLRYDLEDLDDKLKELQNAIDDME